MKNKMRAEESQQPKASTGSVSESAVIWHLEITGNNTYDKYFKEFEALNKTLIERSFGIYIDPNIT